MPALRRYYRGDELIAMRDVQAATTRYYRFDAQGTTQCLTNEAGVVTDRSALTGTGMSEVLDTIGTLARNCTSEPGSIAPLTVGGSRGILSFHVTRTSSLTLTRITQSIMRTRLA